MKVVTQSVVVTRHRTQSNHDFDLDNVKILHSEKNGRRRKIAKMCLIKTNCNAINIQKDTENLLCVYDSLLF